MVCHLCSSEMNASNLCTGLDRPFGHQEVEIPRICRQKWHMNVARLSAPRTGCLYTPQYPQVLIFVGGWAYPRGHSVARRIKPIKNFNYPIITQTHDLRLVAHCFNHLHHYYIPLYANACSSPLMPSKCKFQVYLNGDSRVQMNYRLDMTGQPDYLTNINYM